MKKILHSLVVCFLTVVVVLLSTPHLRAQDLSKYRNFSFGMTVADVSKQIDQKPANAAVLYERPALIQELTWWPPQPYDLSRPAEPVDQILFSFYNGALYRMLVTYEDAATKGLNEGDMIRVVSAKLGSATRPVAAVVDFPMNPSYKATEKVIARWETSQYSLNLVRAYTDTFAIVMFTKQVDAQAGISIAESHEAGTRRGSPEGSRTRQKRCRRFGTGATEEHQDASALRSGRNDEIVCEMFKVILTEDLT